MTENESTTDIAAYLIGKDVLVRTYSAGVFVGALAARNGREVVMTDARRIWYWSGAASLSQLASEGTRDPRGCKFPCVVSKVLLTEAIEIIPLTEEARRSIDAVPVWQK